MRNQVVSHEDWLKARLDLLAAEKEFTHRRDALTRRRREMPWERVEKDYRFEGPNGTLSLADLFDGRSQLVVYHFMFAPDWDEGCKSCSFWADTFDGIPIHLAHRDVAFTAISRAPFAKLDAYRKRLGWSFPGSPRRAATSTTTITSRSRRPRWKRTRPITTTRSSRTPAATSRASASSPRTRRARCSTPIPCYTRGIDMVNGAYQFLDLVPKGRDEDRLRFTMEWVRRNDQY